LHGLAAKPCDGQNRTREPFHSPLPRGACPKTGKPISGTPRTAKNCLRLPLPPPHVPAVFTGASPRQHRFVRQCLRKRECEDYAMGMESVEKMGLGGAAKLQIMQFF